MLSPCLQPLTNGSVLEFFFFKSGSIIVFSIPEMITKHSMYKHE
jgi:hypothetical protein